MCGICGQFNYRNNEPVIHHKIVRMANSIAHRGPDDSGFHLDGSLGLGFRRLSIIDLAGGHQPMCDLDEVVWVVFNGEIYNFPELKRELESHGHTFRTRSDTEVIVHGYKQWGDEVFNHLNGMFGVAIWDVRKRRLVLARDPFGIKPIYYMDRNGQLSFGSEIRAVLADAEEPVEVNTKALNLFLRYRFTPSPYTMFKGVSKLAPGSLLVCENGACNVKLWYKYTPHPFSPSKSPEDATEELLALYKAAMQRHLLSDVPVGLLLSGGVDSGMLLALMNLYGDSWRTFSVGYGSAFVDDELIDAGKTAAALSSQHTEVLLDRQTYESSLRAIVTCLEEPVAASSIVPMYFVSKRAKEDVKVALMGQGPDELFGGYRRHLGVRYSHYWNSAPNWMRAPISSAISVLPRNETLKRGIYSLDSDERMRRYQNVLSLLPGSEIDGLFLDGLLEHNSGDGILDSWRDLEPLMGEVDELGGFQFLEMRSTLPDELLMYGDKLSMAHGLEVRVPFLDREVVEFAERLPASFKVRRGKRKWLHKEVCRKFLPEEVLRRKKKGFAGNVVDEWFRNSMDSQMNAVLQDPESMLFRYLRSDVIGAMLKQHQSGTRDFHKVLFSLIVFEEWLRAQAPFERDTKATAYAII